MKEIHFNTTDEVRIISSYSVHNKYLPAFFRALRRLNIKFEKMKMTYSQCIDGQYRHFGEIKITYSFESTECNVPNKLFWLGKFYQDELVNDENLKYDSLIRRPKFFN